MSVEDEFRAATLTEAAWLQRLLIVDFAGKRELAQQLEGVQVRTIDDEGSLELRPRAGSPPADVENLPVAVEAEAPDQDGILVHLLLHVQDGLVNELEIYKDDGSPIERMPHPSDLQVIVLPFHW